MEFLKALQAAKEQHGMTKEEFMKVWEFESKIALLTEETRKLALTEQKNSNGNVDSYSTLAFKEYIERTTRNMQEFQQGVQQKLNELSLKLDQTNEHLTGLRDQFLSKNELVSEVQQLNSSLLWTMDFHSNSLKKFFSQELQSQGEKFEERLAHVDSVKPLIEEQLQFLRKDIQMRLENTENSRQENEPGYRQKELKPKESKTDSGNYSQPNENLQREFLETSPQHPQQQIPDSFLHQEDLQQIRQQPYVELHQRQEHLQSQQLQEQQQTQLKNCDAAMPRTPQLQGDLQSQGFNTHAIALSSNVEVKHADTSADVQHQMPRPATIMTNESSSTDSSSSSSIVGTGPYAEIIASQLSGKPLGASTSLVPVNRRKPFSFADVVVAWPARKQHALPQPSSNMPRDGATFEIHKAVEFVTSGKYFITSYFYTSPKPARIRLRLKFDGKGHPVVHLLVSEGVLNTQQNWPLVFSGAGFIYNVGSRRYTKLWEVEKQECPRPGKGQEVELEATVSLSTSRGNHKNITYTDLALKRYEDNDVLAFKWEVNAEESKRPKNGILW